MFNQKQDEPKVDDFRPFLDPIYPRKPKILPKTKIFSRTYILMTIKQHKSQVPDKSQNSYKINLVVLKFWNFK